VLVIDRDDRQLEQSAHRIRERVEVGDHQLGIEAQHLVRGGDVAQQRARRAPPIAQQRANALDATVGIDDRQAGDRKDLRTVPREEPGRPPGGGDLQLVAAGPQVLDEHPRPHGVTEALARYSVEDAHVIETCEPRHLCHAENESALQSTRRLTGERSQKRDLV
jgi:hypothetical protein